MTIEILPYSAEHAPVFDRLNRAWIEEYFSVEPFDELVLTQPETYILANGGEIWFAAIDGKVIGTYALLALASGLYEFTKLGVDPSAHGKGVARTMLRHAAVRAKELGAHTLKIFTSTKLVPACTLYRSEGFVEVAMSDEQKARYKRGDIMFDLPL